jgi:hypothetical protein
LRARLSRLARAAARAAVECPRLAREVRRLRAENRALQPEGAESLRGGDPSIRVAHGLDQLWCDRYGLTLFGWAHCYEDELVRLEVEVGEARAVVTDFSERPDVAAARPGLPGGLRCGFDVYVPCRPGNPVSFLFVTRRGARRVWVDLPEQRPEPWGAHDRPGFERFRTEAIARGGRVLEIGSRIVSPGGASNRSLFPRFTGIDIHPAPNVDAVVDAHAISRTLGCGTFEGIFSLAVLEHLSMPWLVAREVNLSLAPGGLTYNLAPHTWPAHEMPNDFWRFSETGLATLFGPASGFEVIDSGLFGRVFVHPDCRDVEHRPMPLIPSYGASWVLSRKTRTLEPGEIAWPTESGESNRRALSYPVPA